MPRRRTAEVRETIEELRQLREYYKETPKATALHLLMLLKEDKRRTIADAAREVGISHRKAERLWKRYREVGLVGVVGEGGIGGKRPTCSQECQYEPKTVVTALETLLMVASILENREELDFVGRLRRLVHRIAPSVSYTAANLVSSTLLDGEKMSPLMSYSYLPDGKLKVSVMNANDFEFHYQRAVASAIRNGVNLSKYVDPPLGQDYYYESDHSRESGELGTYVGSLMFFGEGNRGFGKDLCGLSRSDFDLIIGLRPFFARILISRIQSSVSNNISPVNLSSVVEDIKQEFHLTPTEVKILMVLSIGRSDMEIADLLIVSKSTVRTHIRNIQKKMGLRSRRELQSEVFSRANFISD